MAYDAYSGYQTVMGIRALAIQINQIDALIDKLQKQEKTCPPENRANLNNQVGKLILKKAVLIQQKASEEAKGAAQAAAISAICAGLAKLPLPYNL